MPKFRLLAGLHVQRDTKAEPVVIGQRPNGETIIKRPSRAYTAGEEFESDIDLVAKHGANKFMRVGDSADDKAAKDAKPAAAPAQAVKKPAASLDTMSVAELREHARTNDISLHGASTRDEILAAIRKTK